MTTSVRCVAVGTSATPPTSRKCARCALLAKLALTRPPPQMPTSAMFVKKGDCRLQIAPTVWNARQGSTHSINLRVSCAPLESMPQPLKQTIVWNVELASSQEKHRAPLYARAVMQAIFQKDWPCNAPSVMRVSIHLQEPMNAPNAKLVSTAVKMELPRAQLARLGRFPIEPARPAAQTATRAGFKASTGQSSCQECAAGTFAAYSGSTSCSDCSAGTQSNSSASTVRTVPLGLFLDRVELCVDCEAGKFSNSRTGFLCESCEAGYPAAPSWELFAMCCWDFPSTGSPRATVKLASFPTQIMGLCVRSARPRLDQRTPQHLELPAASYAFRIITCPT